jgi:hypothetical protein
MPAYTHKHMPTAGRLVAAIVFGATGAGAAFVGIPTLPEGMIAGYLLPFSTLVGVWLGWSLMGPKAGGRLSIAITQGIATVVVMVVTVIFFVAAWDMVERSMRLRYKGPGEAVLDIANLFWDYLRMMFSQPLIGPQPVLSVLAIGAIVGSVLINIAARIWK